MEKKKIDKINLGTLIVSIIALSLAIFSTIKSCSSEKEQKNTNYTLSSIDFRPRLKLSNPEIIAINLTADSLPLKRSMDEADSIGDLFVKLSLKVRMRVTNIGNNSAKIIGYACTDTLSNEPILKEMLKDVSRRKANCKDTLKLSHLYKDLTPLDTTHIELDYSPQFINNNQIMIHLILFYENELGQLFDTYYWLDYKTNEIIMPNPQVYKNDKSMMYNFSKNIFKMIEIKDENNYSTIYSEDEKKKFLKSKKINK